MNDFYCDDFYWAVEVDGLARGLFVLEADAMMFYADQCEKRPDDRIGLWRLNGGHLCTPVVASREPPMRGAPSQQRQGSMKRKGRA